MRLRIHCPATYLPNRTHRTQNTHHKQEDEVLHFLISDSRAPLDQLSAGLRGRSGLSCVEANPIPNPRQHPLRFLGWLRLFWRAAIAIAQQFSLMWRTWDKQECVNAA